MSGLDDENNGDTEGEEDLESTDEAQEGLDEEESFDDEIGEGADDYDEGDEDL
ncbi:MAG: copper-binding protein, partial [Gammaproteobacteria bacterium]|nr:copper-binding protein [Gammaproteobacteria bacterium]